MEARGDEHSDTGERDADGDEPLDDAPQEEPVRHRTRDVADEDTGGRLIPRTCLHGPGRRIIGGSGGGRGGGSSRGSGVGGSNVVGSSRGSGVGGSGRGRAAGPSGVVQRGVDQGALVCGDG